MLKHLFLKLVNIIDYERREFSAFGLLLPLVIQTQHIAFNSSDCLRNFKNVLKHLLILRSF